MGYLVQRMGFRISRGWTMLLLVIAGIVAASFWVGPLRPLPAELELLAVAGDAARPVLDAPAQQAADGRVRFAVPLAVRNVGARGTRARQLVLSVPARYHVTTPRGRLTGTVTAGVPLRRYVIELGSLRLDPDPNTVRLPGLDTIWLEPDLPGYYCTLAYARIPEFQPAPEYDVASLSDVRIFYSFATATAGERHTGLLTVRVDASALRAQSAPMPPVFPTVHQEPEADAPDLGALLYAGTRRAFCGDPERPVGLYTVQWETPAGANLYEIAVDGAARKRLYDLTGDGVIDLETWDADGDGRFEVRRQARYAVPDFLLPPPPRDPTMLLPDTAAPRPAWVAVFHNPAAGLWRFTEQRRTDSIAAVAAQLAAENARRLAAADSARAAAFDSAAAPPPRPSPPPQAPPPRPARPRAPRLGRPPAPHAARSRRVWPRRWTCPTSHPRRPTGCNGSTTSPPARSGSVPARRKHRPPATRLPGPPRTDRPRRARRARRSRAPPACPRQPHRRWIRRPARSRTRRSPGRPRRAARRSAYPCRIRAATRFRASPERLLPRASSATSN